MTFDGLAFVYRRYFNGNQISIRSILGWVALYTKRTIPTNFGVKRFKDDLSPTVIDEQLVVEWINTGCKDRQKGLIELVSVRCK